MKTICNKCGKETGDNQGMDAYMDYANTLFEDGCMYCPEESEDNKSAKDDD